MTSMHEYKIQIIYDPTAAAPIDIGLLRHNEILGEFAGNELEAILGRVAQRIWEEERSEGMPITAAGKRR